MRKLLCSTVLGGAMVATAAPALAQDDDDDAIVVTGSRLNQANLIAPSQVTQVDAGEIDSRGTTRIEDLINILPQAFAGQTSEVSNGATGTSNLNLRGLGAIRTLVLIDGKRLPFGSPTSSPANLDLIPAQLLERVDITTGGGSAVYGSDAIGGVANFILRRDFEGIEFDGQVGFYQDSNNNAFSEGVLTAAQQPIPGSVTDGRDTYISATLGANTPDGRGNVTAFISYQDQNAIVQADRITSACAFGPSSGDQSFEGVGCVGSSTFRRFFTPGFDELLPTAAGALDQNGNPIVGGFTLDSQGGDLFQNADGSLVPFAGGPSQTFNFAPDNFFQRPNERFNFTTLARYEITDSIEAYLDLTFVNNTTDAQIAFSGTFFRPFEINCDNPFLSDSLDGQTDSAGNPVTLADSLGCNTPQFERQTFINDEGEEQNLSDADGNALFQPVLDAEGNLIFPDDVGLTAGRRNVEGGPRNLFIDLTTWRAVGGFRGNIGENFQWDAFGQFGRTSLTRISTNDLNFSNTQDALFVVNDANGNPVCRDGAAAGCVPYNIFQRGSGGETLVTQEATDFIQGTAFVNGTTEQIVLGGTFQGDLTEYGFQSPLADAGIQALVGVEYRRDQLESQPDNLSQIPAGRGLTGVGGGTLPVAGEVSVTELFFETQIPLIQGRTFFEELAINGAYRYSDYTTDGNGVENSFTASTFAAGLAWAPVREFRVRGQFQRAIRAPNVIELFTGQNTGLFNAIAGANGLFDPCAGDFDPSTPTPEPAASQAACANTGLSAALYGSVPDNPAGQLNSITGGNPLLGPESSDTFTVGAVFQPTFVDGFSLSVDYFNITVNEAIATIPATTSLAECLETGDAVFCDLIQRDDFGSLFLSNSATVNGSTVTAGVLAANVNIAELSTSGIDFAIGYNLDLGNQGGLNFNYVSTYLLSSAFIPVPGGDEVECVGIYGGQCGNPTAAYRHRFLSTWQTPFNVDLTATWRYFGGVELFGEPTGVAVDDSFDSESYFDIAATWQVRDNVSLRAGMQNIFDNDPPSGTQSGAGFGNGNTYPGIYDSTGRFIFFGVNIGL
ncbi:MAG: TonB-dependent receptor [Pseudomonadota bacterium]